MSPSRALAVALIVLVAASGPARAEILDGRLVGVLDREHAAAVLADEEGSCLCSD